MGLLIGMDEAGYGPNLGPLVVSVTVWEVPGPPRKFDLAAALADIVSASPSPDGRRLHVADSKQVYSAARGIAPLERSVLCGLNLCGHYPAGFGELCGVLMPGRDTAQSEPWFDGRDVSLPAERQALRLADFVDRWRDCCERNGVRLRAIRSDVVLTRRFNELTRRYGSKGLALSRISLKLLRSVWNPDDGEPAFIVADKHGGRNRYDDLLAETFDDGRMILRGMESTPRSDYRVGRSELCFQTKAEEHLPVALSSMVSKYVRELAMRLFNRFWQERLPELRPTAGYPGDAGRFRAEIAAVQAELGIDDETLWRER